MTLAVAFPGQGVDPVDCVAVVDEHAGHELVEIARRLTAVDRLRPRDLADTRIAQPFVVVAGLLAAADSPEAARADVLAGHSLGEITALIHAGALPAEAGLEVVARRAALGHAGSADGAMVAVVKLDRLAVERIRRQVLGETGGMLDVAVVNGPGQEVLSGDPASVARAADLAVEAGGVGRVLGIGGAYHSPLQWEAVEPFRVALLDAGLTRPRVPVVSSTLGAAMVEPGEVAAAVAWSLVLPVDWPAAVRALAGSGVTRVLDAGPGRTLAALADHIDGAPPHGALRPDRRSR